MSPSLKEQQAREAAALALARSTDLPEMVGTWVDDPNADEWALIVDDVIDAFLSKASIPELLAAKQGSDYEAPPESGSASEELQWLRRALKQIADTPYKPPIVDDWRRQLDLFHNLAVAALAGSPEAGLKADNQKSPTELLALAAKGMSQEEREGLRQLIGSCIVGSKTDSLLAADRILATLLPEEPE